MVSAWPEPPSGRPGEPSAGIIAGAITERKRLDETWSIGGGNGFSFSSSIEING